MTGERALVAGSNCIRRRRLYAKRRSNLIRKNKLYKENKSSALSAGLTIIIYVLLSIHFLAALSIPSK